MNTFEKDMQRFIRNALNRTITKCAKEQRSEIKKELDLSAKKLRSITKATRATPFRLEVSLRALKVRLSLNNFKRVQNKQGVTVQISKSKKLFFKGAFLGVREGKSKKNNKEGFLATRYPNENTHGFELAKSKELQSYKNHKSPKLYQAFYFRTKDFSEIVKNIDLNQKAIEIFKEELARE